MTKTPGQVEYERDIAACPTRPNGDARPSWSQLDARSSHSWERIAVLRAHDRGETIEEFLHRP